MVGEAFGPRQTRGSRAWDRHNNACWGWCSWWGDVWGRSKRKDAGTGIELPPSEKYGPEWWESTLRIIVYDALAEAAAFGLERALAVPDKERAMPEVVGMLEAALFLEAVMQRDERSTSAATLKNAGLAYLNLVRSPVSGAVTGLPHIKDPLGASELLPWNVSPHTDLMVKAAGAGTGLEGGGGDRQWKDIAATRFVELWGYFLAHEDSHQDPQYSVIQNMYNTVVRQTGRGTEQRTVG
ncbi:unnamed protein product [Choristocarpus tenellus]